MNGTHGTFRVNVDSIIKDGFRIDGEGYRCGKGAYFWDYSSEQYRSEAFILAKSHWSQSFNKNNCKAIEENDCAVLDVQFDDSLNVVNTLDVEVRERLHLLLSLQEDAYTEVKERGQQVDYDGLSGVYDHFIELVEKVSGKVVDAMRFTVNVNRKYFPRRYTMLNDPTCLVVKDPEKVIDIQVEYVDMLQERCG